MAKGKRPAPFRTRKLSLSAPMVLHGRLCGRVGRRRTYFEDEAHPPSGWASSHLWAMSFRGSLRGLGPHVRLHAAPRGPACRVEGAAPAEEPAGDRRSGGPACGSAGCRSLGSDVDCPSPASSSAASGSALVASRAPASIMVRPTLRTRQGSSTACSRSGRVPSDSAPGLSCSLVVGAPACGAGSRFDAAFSGSYCVPSLLERRAPHHARGSGSSWSSSICTVLPLPGRGWIGRPQGFDGPAGAT
jgi:hypothetical protein